MSGMKHALNGNMARYLQDAKETKEPWKRWRLNTGSWWTNCYKPPAWCPRTKYERIPQTIRIGDREVPAPYRGPMEDGRYYVVDITLSEKIMWFDWGGGDEDHRYMERGLAHLTEEAALENADALLALLGGE